MLYGVLNNHKDYLLPLVTAIFLFCVAINFNDWAYDEYAAVFSHLELDDPRIINLYSQMMISLGIPIYVIDYVISPILSVLIVPLRWTYAVGISPLYSIIRIDALSWETVKILLHLGHSFVAFVGLSLIAASFPKGLRGVITPALFSLIVLSSSFVYWSVTFTSYSYHLLCFGLLTYEYTHKSSSRNLYFGGSSLMRTLVVLLSYQYVFCLVCMGSIALITKRLRFFSEGLYRSWILPAIVSSISIVLIFSRLYFSGTDTVPTHNYPEANDLTLVYDGSIDGIVNLLQLFSTRLLDISHYFFSGSDRDYFVLRSLNWLSIWQSLLALLFLVIGTYILNRALRPSLPVQRILRLCFIMLGSQFLLYILGILPMSPTRHSLVLFLPSAVILVLSIYLAFTRFFEPKVWFQRLVIVGFLIALLSSGKHFFETPIGTESKKQVDCLVASSVNTIVLDACFYEPLLQNKGNKNVQFVYSCGPNVVDKLHEETKTVAFLSRHFVEPSSVMRELAKYSALSWKPNDLELASFSACVKLNEDRSIRKKESVKINLFGIKG